MKMKKGILYKVKEGVPGFWRHYIFINKNEMIIFDESLLKSEYRDDLQEHLIDKEDYEKVSVSKLNKISKRAIIRGVL